MKKIFLIIILFFNILLCSNTITVNQDGSGDYTTIQSAVDNANAGDTIRVYPGTYYENILIEKDLALVSNYEYTNNEADINNTILDGNQTGSVITFIGTNSNRINNYLCGFTITNGSGYIRNPYNPSRTAGGGIYVTYSNIILKKCIIKNNTAVYAGGIEFFEECETNLIGCTIKYNRALYVGGGILQSYYSNINYDNEILNNIYLNHAGIGNDIYISHYNQFQEIIVDTFTVINPNENYYYIYPGSDGAGIPEPNLFSVDIQHGKIEQVNNDLYVSASGNNSNSGLTINEPLQSIAFALAKIKSDSLIHRTIHVANGIYSASLTNENLPLHIKSNISIIGESREDTILDAEFYGGHVFAKDPQKDYSIENFTFLNAQNFDNINITLNTNVNVKNILIMNHIDNLLPEEPGGRVMTISFTDFSLDNVIIKNNSCEGIYIYTAKDNPNLNITNCLFENNSDGSGFHALGIGRDPIISDSLIVNLVNTQIVNNLDQSSADWLPTSVAVYLIEECKMNIVNCTISGNETIQNQGAAIAISDESSCNIVNSILYGDSPRELFLDGRYGPINLTVKNSLISGGLWNIGQYGTNTIDWDYSTNLDEDPHFVGEGEYPFALSSTSPCIDAGTMDLPEGVTLPETDLAGNPRVVGSSVDMGAYEYQYIPDSQDDELQVPDINTTFISVYPNPFRISSTKSEVTIKLELSMSGKIKLEVYNLKGQKIKTLLDLFTATGKYNIKWNGKDENGKKISSGMYLIKLIQNDRLTRVGRLTVIK